MAAGQDDDAEKSFEPTPKKLQDARKKGDVVKSQDVNATAAYAGLFLGFVIVATGELSKAATGLMVFLDQPTELTQLFFDGSARAPMGQALSMSLGFMAIVFLIPAAAVILSAIAQQSIVFAPTKLAPKLNRISPISQAKQKFGPSGLFEFFKSFLKLVVISVVMTIFLSNQLPQILVTPNLEATQSVAYLWDLSLIFLAIVICIQGVIGGLDYTFQYFEHRRKLMMSRKEVMDETKESDGDPYLKQERMQRGRERAMSQALKDVETADVVITNPTHYAIALHWSREPGSAPKCVAKGMDEIALAIRERAKEHGVPIHEDPPTARALHSTTEVGQEIPGDLYQAVATAIRFAEAMRQRVKSRGF